jgi:hypothetical protein
VIVESTDSDQSISPAASAAPVSVASIWFHVPSAARLRCQVHPGCHGPNTSGSSRQAIPHRYRQMMPLIIVRASEKGLPFHPVEAGRIGSTNHHWASESN